MRTISSTGAEGCSRASLRTAFSAAPFGKPSMTSAASASSHVWSSGPAGTACEVSSPVSLPLSSTMISAPS